MNQIDDGGAAYPRTGYRPSYDGVSPDDFPELNAATTDAQSGMTLLDYFAAHALNGLIAMTADGPHDRRLCLKVANSAYAYAQEMIAARRRVTGATPMCECDDDGQDGGGAASKPPGAPLIPPPKWGEWDLPGPPPAG